MDSDLKLFSVSVVARLQSDEREFAQPDVEHLVGFVLGSSQEEVTQSAMEAVLEQMPVESGWFAHDIAVLEVPLSLPGGFIQGDKVKADVNSVRLITYEAFSGSVGGVEGENEFRESQDIDNPEADEGAEADEGLGRADEYERPAFLFHEDGSLRRLGRSGLSPAFINTLVAPPRYYCRHNGQPAKCTKANQHYLPSYGLQQVLPSTTCPECHHEGTLYR
jgi:hypothetical protein